MLGLYEGVDLRLWGGFRRYCWLGGMGGEVGDGAVVGIQGEDANSKRTPS